MTLLARLPEDQPVVYPCCEHCHDHGAPWLGSESLIETGDGHTEPCQNCEPRGMDEDCADGLHEYCLTETCICDCHEDGAK